MNDSDLIDVETLDFLDDQVWLHKTPNDRGDHLDIVDWCLSLDWPVYEDDEYDKTEKKLYEMLDDILNKQVLAMPDKHKFDSRTYVRPKRRVTRPSIQQIVEVASPPTSSPLSSLNNNNNNKYLTYNKYSTPLGPILRHKTFNVDTNTDNSNAIKEALKRRSLVQEDEQQLEDVDLTLVDTSERLSTDPAPTATKPITIDLSQPAHNLHNTFNKGIPNMMLGDRGSLNMYQSGESLMRMSPPSLVSSLMMESSGSYNPEPVDTRKSAPSPRDSGLPASGRESIDPMMTSMTLSILDEKDMSTSFLSQTTYPDHDSLMDSLPPSLVSSVNSSYIVKGKADRESTESTNNVFSSATFTHLEQSEKLLSARPRCANMYNSLRSSARRSESYTKAKEEACQIDQGLISGESEDKGIKDRSTNDEPITLHYANNKFRRNITGKENVDTSFEKDDAFYKDMGMTRTTDLCRNSMNVTLDKQELNEIIQARQKLSLARRGLPADPTPLPNQVESPPKPRAARSPTSPNRTLTSPQKSIDKEELLSRRRAMANGHADTFDKEREPPKRNATFRCPSPDRPPMDRTMVYLPRQPQPTSDDTTIIDINSATLHLVDDTPRTAQEWTERAMVGSSESTDTGTYSSASPPDSVPSSGTRTNDHISHISSTPLTIARNTKSNLMSLHTTISPIYNMVDDKSYTVAKAPSSNSTGTYDISNHNATVINSNTIIRNSTAKRDILASRVSPEKKMTSPTGRVTVSQPTMVPPSGLVRKSCLPTSKLRQYSSHKDLRIPVSNGASNPAICRPTGAVGRLMLRRNVYGSNPALSPTAPPPPSLAAPLRRDSYTIATEEVKPAPPVPALVRQGTETLRRERPQSQLMQPKDLRAANSATAPAPVMRNHPGNSSPTRPYSIAGAAQLRVTKPVSAQPVPKPSAVGVTQEPRPALSALPRPTRLPGPRRALRPPSVYSVAPTADMDHY